jgi:hypothetical protein
VVIAAFVHFADRVLLRPSLHDGAVEREDHASPVSALLAVHEERPVRTVREDPKRLDHERVLSGPGPHRHVQKLQRRLARRLGVAVTGAKVENGFDAQRGKFLESGRIGLGAPKQVGLDPVEIRHVRTGDRARPGRRPGRPGIGECSPGDPENPGEGEG